MSEEDRHYGHLLRLRPGIRRERAEGREGRQRRRVSSWLTVCPPQ